MIRNLLFFQLQKLIGSRVYDCYREFFQLEKATPDKLRRVQSARLSALLEHAVSAVPYYEQCVPSVNRKLSISDFPILTKKDIREHFYDLMTDKLRKEYCSGGNMVYSWTAVKTGGSTGIPTIVIHDREFRDAGRASRLYSQYLCGFPFSTPYFRLWGSMQEINQMRDSIHHRVMRLLSGEILLNAFRMGNEQIKEYIKIINVNNVEHMMAYVDAAYQLAKYSSMTEMPIKPMKSIMACAGTVTDEIRQVLKQVLQTRVHNKYGSRDCADMACECEAGGMHIYANNVFLEVVDNNGNPLPNGESGRILVTLLYNYSFPLIRYEIGDVGTLTDQVCVCERPFPLLEHLEGRTVEFLMTNDGGYITPVYIRHLIGVVHNPGFIKRFQLIQNSLVNYELKLELEKGVSEQDCNVTIERIVKDLKAVFGSNSTIIVDKVNEMLPSQSGKYLYTINKVNKT